MLARHVWAISSSDLTSLYAEIVCANSQNNYLYLSFIYFANTYTNINNDFAVTFSQICLKQRQQIHK